MAARADRAAPARARRRARVLREGVRHRQRRPHPRRARPAPSPTRPRSRREINQWPGVVMRRHLRAQPRQRLPARHAAGRAHAGVLADEPRQVLPFESEARRCAGGRGSRREHDGRTSVRTGAGPGRSRLMRINTRLSHRHTLRPSRASRGAGGHDEPGAPLSTGCSAREADLRGRRADSVLRCDGAGDPAVQPPDRPELRRLPCGRAVPGADAVRAAVQDDRLHDRRSARCPLSAMAVASHFKVANTARATTRAPTSRRTNALDLRDGEPVPRRQGDRQHRRVRAGHLRPLRRAGRGRRVPRATATPTTSTSATPTASSTRSAT